MITPFSEQNPYTVITPLSIAKGEVTGHILKSKFGRNSNINTGTIPESIWNGGGLYTGFNAIGAETVNIRSNSSSDTSAGIGARTIKIIGLDSNYDEAEETVILNGTSNVESVNSYLRLDRAIVLTAGSSGYNIGTINIEQSASSSVVFVSLPPQKNQTHIACFTVPNGYTAYVMSITSTLNDHYATNSMMDIMIREENNIFKSKAPYGLAQSGGAIHFNGYPVLTLEQKTDIDIRCTFTSSNGTDITFRTDYILVAN
jgi:hypothetical protein